MSIFRCVFSHEIKKSVQDRTVLASVFLMPLVFVLVTSLLLNSADTSQAQSRIFVLHQALSAQETEQVKVIPVKAQNLHEIEVETTLSPMDVVLDYCVDEPTIYFFSANSNSVNAANWCKELCVSLALTNAVSISIEDLAERIHISDMNDVYPNTGTPKALFLPYLLVMLLFQTASEYATEAIAGEKERGVFCKVILSPNKSAPILWGKLLSCVICSLAGSIIYFLIAFFVSWATTVDIYGLMELKISPVVGLCYLLCVVMLCCLFAGLAIWASLHSKTKKEVHEKMLPVIGVILIMAIAAALHKGSVPGVFFVVPVYNIFVLFQDSPLSPEFYEHLTFSFLSLCGWTYIFFAASISSIHQEENWN